MCFSVPSFSHSLNHAEGALSAPRRTTLAPSGRRSDEPDGINGFEEKRRARLVSRYSYSATWCLPTLHTLQNHTLHHETKPRRRADSAAQLRARLRHNRRDNGRAPIADGPCHIRSPRLLHMDGTFIIACLFQEMCAPQARAGDRPWA